MRTVDSVPTAATVTLKMEAADTPGEKWTTYAAFCSMCGWRGVTMHPYPLYPHVTGTECPDCHHMTVYGDWEKDDLA